MLVLFPIESKTLLAFISTYLNNCAVDFNFFNKKKKKKNLLENFVTTKRNVKKDILRKNKNLEDE